MNSVNAVFFRYRPYREPGSWPIQLEGWGSEPNDVGKGGGLRSDSAGLARQEVESGGRALKVCNEIICAAFCPLLS